MEKVVYQGQITRVTEESLEGITWERVYLPDGVIVFPLDDEGKILLVEERRPHETPPVRIKPVSGMLEPARGTPEVNAQIELQEEIGYRATTLEKFWTFQGSGTIAHTQHFYIARGLVPSKLPNPDGEDTILGLKAYGLEELLDAFLNDQIRWSISTLGFFRLYHYLRASRK